MRCCNDCCSSPKTKRGMWCVLPTTAQSHCVTSFISQSYKSFASLLHCWPLWRRTGWGEVWLFNLIVILALLLQTRRGIFIIYSVQLKLWLQADSFTRNCKFKVCISDQMILRAHVNPAVALLLWWWLETRDNWLMTTDIWPVQCINLLLSSPHDEVP